MKILISEKLSEHKYKTPEGYLICCDAILSRTGKQQYRRCEVFGDSCDSPDEIIDIDRSEKEVFDEKTMASFENKPITIEHPIEEVTVDNYKNHAVGYARDIRKGDYEGQPVMIGNLVITDPEAIEKIENGELTDLSCGYDCDITDDENPQQIHIRGNHIALCQEGRAGIAHIVDSKMKDSEIQKVEKWLKSQNLKRKYKLSETSEGIKIESEDGQRIGIIIPKGIDEENLTVDIKKHDSERPNHIVYIRQFVKDSEYRGITINNVRGHYEYKINGQSYSADDLSEAENDIDEILRKEREIMRKDSKMKDSQYSFKLAKTKNEYDEYVIKCYKDGRRYTDGDYYTDDFEDAVNTLKAMAKQYKLNYRQQGNVHIADIQDCDLTEDSVKKLINIVKTAKQIKSQSTKKNK